MFMIFLKQTYDILWVYVEVLACVVTYCVSSPESETACQHYPP